MKEFLRGSLRIGLFLLLQPVLWVLMMIAMLQVLGGCFPSKTYFMRLSRGIINL